MTVRNKSELPGARQKQEEVARPSEWHVVGQCFPNSRMSLNHLEGLMKPFAGP